MFVKVLYNILDDLNGLSNREETFKKCIAARLNTSYELYLDGLEKERKYLLSRSNLKVVKNIEREAKRKEVNHGS